MSAQLAVTDQEVEMPDISSEHFSYIERFVHDIGKEWLESELAKQADRRAPLVNWIELYITSENSTRPNLAEVFALARLARSLDILRRAGIDRVDEVAKSLKQRDSHKFHSTVHELITASGYVDAGYQVELIPEDKSRRRPEMVVADEIEVECKLKMPPTERDKGRYELYDLLKRRAEKLVEGHDSPGVEVWVTFTEEPVREDIDELLALIRQAIRPDGAFQFIKTHGRCRYRIVARRQDFPTAAIQTRHYTGLHLYCEVESDYIQSLKRSLDDARGQFSGQKAAIIHVDVTSSLRHLIGDQLDDVRKMLASFLRNNKTVSAVSIEYDNSEMGEDGRVLSRRREYLWNESASRPVSAEMRDEIESRMEHD
jgi:hypothetical protein